jgi:hypothetical protein
VIAGVTYGDPPAALAANTPRTGSISPISPTTNVPETVTFAPEVGASPAPLGPISTTVTFRTVTGVSGVTEASDAVVFTRENPEYLVLDHYTPSDRQVALAGGDVMVYVNTNVDWWINKNGGTNVEDNAVTGYMTNRSLLVNVPGRTTSDASPLSPLTTTINYGSSSGSTSSYFTVTQPAYTMTVSGLPASIAAGGGPVTFTITTNWPGTYTLQMKSGSTVLGYLNNTTGGGSKSITVDANTTGPNPRTVILYSPTVGAQIGDDMTQPKMPEYRLERIYNTTTTSCPGGGTMINPLPSGTNIVVPNVKKEDGTTHTGTESIAVLCTLYTGGTFLPATWAEGTLTVFKDNPTGGLTYLLCEY